MLKGICVVPPVVVLSGCLCSPVLWCEAHSQGSVLSSFLTHCYCVKAQAFVHYQTLIPNSLSPPLAVPLSFTVLSTSLLLWLLFFPRFFLPLF